MGRITGLIKACHSRFEDKVSFFGLNQFIFYVLCDGYLGVEVQVRVQVFLDINGFWFFVTSRC